MDKLIIGIVIIWGGLWLLGVVLRVLSDFATAVGQQWERTRPGRERVGSAIRHPMGVLAATVEDHRLMSTGFAIILFVAALFLAGTDSATLIFGLDSIGGKEAPLLGWTIFGGISGIVLGGISKAIELNWFDLSSVSRVPDIEHLRKGEMAAARYFRIRIFAAAVGAVILVAALTFSHLRNAGYDSKDDAEKKAAVIAAAGMEGRITILNSALGDSVGRLQSDPGTGLKTLLALKDLSKDGVRPEVDRVAKIAQRYLELFRDETEKLVTGGDPEALDRSKAYLDVDRVASLKWLGRLYEAGKGGANKDLSKAFSFYGEAAGAGDKTAATMQDKVAHMMITAKDEGTRQEAFKYLEPRAQSGGPNDHYWFGQWYAGSGKPEDQKNAEKWLAKALSQAADATVKNLAFSSLAKLKDIGTAATTILDEQAPKYAKSKDENMKKVAYAYLEQRANAGDPGAILWIGFRHAEGDGIPKDEKKAHDWFLKAALQNNNQVVKNKAFEALGERKHPPIMGTEPKAPDLVGSGNTETAFKDSPVISQQQPIPVAPPVQAAPTRNVPGIPVNASMDYGGRSWSCNKGYVVSRNECMPLQIPPNASMDYAGHSWSCNKGYVQFRNECVILQIPPNASMDYAGHSWSCDKGYVQFRNECVRLQIPPNASMDYAGHSWSCNKGYVQFRNECVILQIPPNASMDYAGHSWSCDKGFVQLKNECVPLQIPPNATMDYGGHSWTCNQGYGRSGYSCVLR